MSLLYFDTHVSNLVMVDVLIKKKGKYWLAYYKRAIQMITAPQRKLWKKRTKEAYMPSRSFISLLPMLNVGVLSVWRTNYSIKLLMNAPSTCFEGLEQRSCPCPMHGVLVKGRDLGTFLAWTLSWSVLTNKRRRQRVLTPSKQKIPCEIIVGYQFVLIWILLFAC